jgi:hypothetical protein
MLKAIKLSNFFIAQARWLCASKPNKDNELAVHFTKIIDYSRRTGLITAKQVKQAIWSLRETDPNQIRNWFIELEKMGYGKTSGQGTRLRFSVNSSY